MVSLPFPLGGSPSGVRRPALEVSFGSGGPGDWGPTIASVSVESGLVPSVDVVVIVAAADQAPSLALGDSGSVAVGYEDSSAELVFTGRITAVRRKLHGVVRLEATNGGALLAGLRIDQSYEQRKAGEIVADLAQRAGVTTGVVEDGASYPFYVVDGVRTVLTHIAALARRSGFVAYVTPEDKLSFLPLAEGQPVQTFAYGTDVLSLQLSETTPAVGALTVVGEGAAGSQGQEAWSWLAKDPSAVRGSSGTAAPELSLADASLRSRDAAQGAAEGQLALSALTGVTGRLLVPGAPSVAVGATIAVEGAPQEALNGTCVARGVRHSFSKRRGFTTTIWFSQGAGGGLGLGGLI
ncbi:MAG: hypothetical protein HY330_02380 [Chloroflexi bacterium]|nr:hypothetical protein [Chloroflexota bacterium]